MAATVFFKSDVEDVGIGFVVWHPDGEFRVEKIVITRCWYEFYSAPNTNRCLEVRTDKRVLVKSEIDTYEDWWKWASTDVVTWDQVWGMKDKAGEWQSGPDGEHLIFPTRQSVANHCEELRRWCNIICTPVPYTRPRAIEFQSDSAE